MNFILTYLRRELNGKTMTEMITTQNNIRTIKDYFSNFFIIFINYINTTIIPNVEKII